MTRFGGGCALVLVGALVGYFALPETPAQLALATVALVVGAVVLVRAVAVHRSLVWGLLGGALIASGLGEATWAAYEAAGADPFPSIADAFYLAAYPALGAAILLLLRRHVPSGDRATIIDAGIVAVGASALAWVLLGAPYLDEGGSILAISVALAYPLGDLLVLGILCRLLLSGGGYPAWVRIFAAGMAAMLVADGAFLVLDVQGSYYSGHPIDAGWITFYVLTGAAACHSSARRPVDSTHPVPDAHPLRLGLLAASVLMAPLVLLGLVVRGDHSDADILGVAFVNVVLLGLVLVRLGMLLRERTLGERERTAQAGMLRSVIASSQSLVYIKDLEGRYLLVNEAFEHALGMQRADLLGKTDDVVEPGQAEVWRAHDRLARQGAHSVIEHWSAPDGERTYETTKFPLYDADGALYATGGVSLDVTEYRRAAGELAAARDDALAAAAAKSAFLAAMSHEIRTPMNAVIGMTGLLMETPLSSEQRNFVQTVRTSGDALLDIINNILDYSKIEVGELRIESHPFVLAEVVEDALDLVSAQAAAKGLTLVADVDPAAPRRVNGDVTRLRQVLVNLLSNAVKFTEAGNVLVSIRAESIEAGLRLHGAVTDTGIGIPAAAIPRLFHPFTQVDDSTTRVYGGTGLGLVISSRLTEAMGGALEVDSHPGAGSTFRFTAVVGACDEPADTGPPIPPGRAVLLVEPHEATRRVLRGHLVAWGLECAEAVTAAEARAQGAARPFDLVLLDHHLGAGNGLAAALRSGTGADTVPLIALTGIGSQVAPEQAEHFADSLAKPVRIGALRDAVSRALGVEVRVPHQVVRDAGAATPRGLRVLLVEDNVVNQMVGRLMVTKMGHVVDTVGNGQEALTAVHARPYDVVLMDVQMPVMDGLEATRRIRAELPAERQPVILAMTASALVNDRAACTEAGMDDHISKPVRTEELLAALTAVGVGAVQPTGH